MKRILSLVLGLILCATLAVPVPALAIGADTGQIITAKYGASPDNALYSAAATAQSAPGVVDPNCPYCGVPVSVVNDFEDVLSNHTFHDAIIWCAGEGIVGGYGDGSFRPSNTVSRSNFTVMLSRAFYADDVAKYSTDYYLSRGMFFPNYMAMEMNNVLTNTSFRYTYDSATEMNKGINRYDMAQLMTNIMKNKGFTASDSDKNAAIGKITDYSSIPSQYKNAVANVYALGVIGGYADGSFNGAGTMNRGQAAVVIYRMMQYFGGGSQITPPDPEIPVIPDTGDVYCNCVTVTGKICEICHVTDPGTTKPVEPEKPVDPKPVDPTPVDPTPSGNTLANGKAITEANVSEILAQLQARYPHNTSFGQGYAGLNTGRNPNTNCIAQITNQYWCTQSHSQHTSTTAGCGGWAACVADEIFGQTGVTWRKTTMANIRPGDLMIQLDNDGYLMHVEICAGYVSGFDPTIKVRVASAGSNGSGMASTYKIGWNNCVTNNQNFDVYTAYPA